MEVATFAKIKSNLFTILPFRVPTGHLEWNL